MWRSLVKQNYARRFRRFGSHSSSAAVEEAVAAASAVVQKRLRGHPSMPPEELVHHFCRSYKALSEEGQAQLLKRLSTTLVPSVKSVLSATGRFRLAVEEPEQWQAPPHQAFAAYEALREETAPEYETLWREVAVQSDNGVEFLVALRADLLATLKRSKPPDSQLRALDRGLRLLLQQLFGTGFLELRRITYERSSGALLEKIFRYEQVHAVRDVADLKRRLGRSRRCFAFFHPSLPGEPLVFVHVALLPELPATLADIVSGTAAHDALDRARCAAFYSISATQRGLTGVQLGHTLIKRVVRVLQSDVPNVTAFGTLSPIPGFMAWLKAAAVQRAALGAHHPLLAGEPPLLRREDEEVIAGLCTEAGSTTSTEEKAALRLLELLEGPWHEDAETAAYLEPVLMRLAATYLIQVRRRERLLDPVGNFHVSNGASVHRINWFADPSPRGLAQSAGMMVNYSYRAEDISGNQRAYAATGEVAASSKAVALLRDVQLPPATRVYQFDNWKAG